MLHLGIGSMMLCGLGLCALLRPDPSGVGTHRQLGLPDCLICLVTGKERCPSCGLTTGLAHLMRGHWHQATATHAAAPVVFVVWCGAACYCLAIAALGIDWLTYEIWAMGLLCTTGFVFWLLAL